MNLQRIYVGDFCSQLVGWELRVGLFWGASRVDAGGLVSGGRLKP